MILVFRLLPWAEKLQLPCPKLLALAGIASAGLILASWIVWLRISHDKSHLQR